MDIKNGIVWKKTHCARMDHGGCSLLVGVKDNKIVEIKLKDLQKDFPSIQILFVKDFLKLSKQEIILTREVRASR